MDDEERQNWLKDCWSDKCLAITEHMKLYYAVGEMMDVIGAHGTICARDDRVQAVMNALYEIDGGNRMTPNVEVTGSPALSASPRGLPGYALEGK